MCSYSQNYLSDRSVCYTGCEYIHIPRAADMTKAEAIQLFGCKQALAEALGVHRSLILKLPVEATEQANVIKPA